MNINRHNYETFFLLYVDKELSAAEVKAVDVFVSENPDLKEELLLLQQSILMPDEINIDFKPSLLKEESITALQENLLLFIDGELNARDKKSLQLQLQKDTAAAAELNILQQAKITPDTNIVFADKQLLYRKEPARVVGIKWWRMAAAAVIFGFGIWGATSIYNKQNTKAADSSNVVKSGPVKNDQINAPAKNDGSNTVSPADVTNQQAADVQNTAVVKTPKQNVVPVVRTPNTTQEIKVVKDKVQNEKENMAVINSNKKETNNLPAPLENFNSIERNKNNSSFVTPVESNNARDPQKDIALVKSDTKDKLKGITLTEPANPIAINAVAKENPDEPIAMDQQTKHSKFGGFLRKVKRVIERTTKIKTGDEDVIKVAGFDIAIK